MEEGTGPFNSNHGLQLPCKEAARWPRTLLCSNGIMPSPNLPLIAQLEESLLHAWPAVETRMIEGWAVRFAHGYSSHANSASAFTKASASLCYMIM
jgi:hypothetical protein